MTRKCMFALLLAIDRRIPENTAALRAHKWNKKEFSKADGVFGKTLGVIGAGQIGREVIRRARAFGLRRARFYENGPTSLNRSAGAVRWARRAACNNSSRPFSGWSRPTNSTRLGSRLARVAGAASGGTGL